MSVNKVILIGRLGADPQVEPVGATTVCKFSLATSERWKDKDGNAQEKTEWHRVVVWGGVAESCGKYLAKGREAYIEGSVETRKWTDKDGMDRYTTEIKARTVKFLSGGLPKADSPQRNYQSVEAESSQSQFTEDDVPF